MTGLTDSGVGPYDFLAPPRILFGGGRLDELGAAASLLGRQAWLVGGGRSLAANGVRHRIHASLAAAGIAWRDVASTAGEPTVSQVAAALAAVADLPRDGVVVVAVGGGSTIDLAKAVAALATNMPRGADDAPPGDAVPDSDAWYDALVVDHLEGVGRGTPLRHWPLPVVAVPTTAGTGAEATRNAVLSCARRGFKKSLRSPLLVPRVALVDPELTASCDRATIAASGLDCITQLIESFVCRFRSPLTRGLVLEALPRAVAALPRLLRPTAAEDAAPARAALAHAALVSGMALTNSGLGMAHGVAAALGIATGTPHGLACAVMLPTALRVNLPAAGPDFALLERAVAGDASAHDATAAEAFVRRIAGLCAEAGVPGRLSDLGVRADQLDWLAAHSGGASMRGNPVELGPAALRDILAAQL